MCLRSAERAAQGSQDLLDHRRLRPTCVLLKHILISAVHPSGVRPRGNARASIPGPRRAPYEGAAMGDELDMMGPVDYLVVEFPDARVPGDVLQRILDLVDRGTVRILDLAFIRKEADGSVTGLEIADLDGDGELDLRVLEGATSGLVADDDLNEAAAAIEPGTAAAIVVYENLWAIPFVSALRRAGAELVASGRIPVAALLDALDAVEGVKPVDA